MNKSKGTELKGRVAFITGGSRGIGFAIAVAMATEGASIAICGRSKKDLNKAVALIKKTGAKCRGYVTDATDAGQVKDTVADIKKDFKRLDILVNNIGGALKFANFEGLNDSDWQEVFDINLMSMVRFSREALPLLRQSKCARIINMASVSGKRPGNFIPHYGAMKAAMIHLSKYLSNQWGRYGILVNAICPHTVKGGAWVKDVADRAKREGSTFKQAEEKIMKEISSKTILGGVVELDDVANLAVYLASDKGKFITGSCLVIDGGAVNSIF